MCVCVCVLLQPVIHLDIMSAIDKFILGMKVIRHAEVDSRMIILDNQACQQMTLHFQLSLQCNFRPSRASQVSGFFNCMPEEACDRRNLALK